MKRIGKNRKEKKRWHFNWFLGVTKILVQGCGWAQVFQERERMEEFVIGDMCGS